MKIDDSDFSIGPGDKETVKLYMLMGLIARKTKDPDTKRIARAFHDTLNDMIYGEKDRQEEVRKTRRKKKH
jgi:hypothetical protein